MLIFLTVVFFISLVGIIGLFAVKHWERTHSRVLYSNVRAIADKNAAKLKVLVHMRRAELSKLPPQALVMAKKAVHAGALGAARLARAMESKSHQLADLVSHKHHFEKRETRSEFLKQVGEHPLTPSNGGNTADNGQKGGESL
ncbi:MAG: hypothetical protein NUV88_00295 [Candidatus Kaiserbacteria bacterium]|nr:hypothetical protein [Candidatus Kaiserbacteria bacterium]